MIKRAQIPFENAIPMEFKVSPESMGDFVYSKISNAFNLAYNHSVTFYGFLINPLSSALKCYQDLLVLSFIENNLPEGAKILDVGGGYSRVLRHLKYQYECWCADKYEGLGNGSKVIPTEKEMGYRIVLDYMGNFNSELPENYFDFVFSISSLEHNSQDAIKTSSIIKDINRVLRPGGFSLHCMDMVVDKKEKIGISLAEQGMFFMQQEFFSATSRSLPPVEEILSDHDLMVLPKEIYTQWNLPVSYDDFCIIDSCAFWKNEDLL